MDIVVYENGEDYKREAIGEFKSGDMTSEEISAFKEYAEKKDFGCLAGPQVGIQKRIIFLDGEVYINPYIEDISKRGGNTFDICDNFPGKRISTKRYSWVEVAFQKGDKIETKIFEETQGHYMQFCLDWLDGSLGEVVDSIKQDIIKNEEVTVGRNDPCPCGSGKKHKKCCMGKA